MNVATEAELHCPSWVTGKLYKFLCESLPGYRTESRNVLDIPRLGVEMDMTEEGIYKWFRKGYITMKNARRLHDLSVSLHVETDSESEPPAIDQFYEFVS